MKLLASSFAAALLLLLLASRTTDATPAADAAASPPRQRTSLAAVSSDLGVSPSPEEAAGAGNEDEERAANPGTSATWYRMLPNMTQGEQASPDGQLSYVPALKEGWDAVRGQVGNFNPGQLREAAVAQMRRFHTVATGGDQRLKVPPIVQKILDDPEARRNVAQLALGAMSVAAAGMMMGGLPVVRDVTLVTLYVTSLLQLVRGGLLLAEKVAAEAVEQESVKKARGMVREKLAKLLGVRLDDEAKTDALDEQQ